MQFLIALEENCPYELVFLDILMPNVDGRERLRMIRMYEQERGIQGLDGVMTTCLDDPVSILGSFKEGCEAYLTKPIFKHKFERVIAGLMSQKSDSTEQGRSTESLKT